jgi:hypothetical protein
MVEVNEGQMQRRWGEGRAKQERKLKRKERKRIMERVRESNVAAGAIRAGGGNVQWAPVQFAMASVLMGNFLRSCIVQYLLIRCFCIIVMRLFSSDLRQSCN